MVGTFSVPPGKTFFGDMKATFNDVSVGPAPDHKIPTAALCDAAEAFANLMLLENSKAFQISYNDMAGNIKKLRNAYLKDPIGGEYVQDLVVSEQKKKVSPKNADVNNGLFYLTLGLLYSAGAIRMSVQNPDKSLSECFGEVYTVTLEPWHSWAIKTASKLALYAIPNRDNVIPLLGKDDEQVRKDMEAWLEGLDKVTAVLKPYVETVCAPFLGLKKAK